MSYQQRKITKNHGETVTDDGFPVDAGAASGTRTRDLFVTNEMLYRLSYCGLVHCDVLQCGCKGSTIFLIPQTLIDNLFAVG